MAMQLGPDRRTATINVTPMIDILLVLLIVFMIIIPTKSIGLRAHAPQPDDGSTSRTPDPTTVVVYAKGDGTVEINRQPLPLADLPRQLVEIFGARRDLVLFVDGEPRIEFHEVAVIIDMAKGLGIERVGLMPGRRR